MGLLLRLSKFKKFLGTKVWTLFILSVFVGVLWFFVESSFIFVLQGFLVSVGLIKSGDTFLPDFYPRTVQGSLTVFFLFGLMRSLGILLKQYCSDSTNQSFVRSQRDKVLEYSLLNSKNVISHDVLNVFNERIPQAANVIQQLASLINTSVSVALFFFLGFNLAPAELLLGISLLFLLLFPFLFLNKFITSYGEELIKESKVLSKIILIGLRNHYLLKVYNLINGEVIKGKNAAKNYESTYKKFSFLSALKSAFPQLVGSIVLTVVCFASIHYIKTESMKLISFIYIFMRIAQGMSEASTTMSAIKFNLGNFKELYLWHLRYLEFSLTDFTETPKALSVVKPSSVSIEVKNLHYSYEGAKELFNGLNLNIKKGEILVIKGRSGTGKSTLLSLILGLAKPSSGDILFSGEVVSTNNKMSDIVAYVGPEPYLIEGTIRDNVMYACTRLDVSDDEIIKAMCGAQLHDIVIDGLEKKLGEVTELSTGQKQRLAIARALIRNPSILILDEATANLDVETESMIVSLVGSISRDLLTIIVSHKDCFDAIATQILDLEKRAK